jgi:hypothetical protein
MLLPPLVNSACNTIRPLALHTFLSPCDEVSQKHGSVRSQPATHRLVCPSKTGLFGCSAISSFVSLFIHYSFWRLGAIYRTSIYSIVALRDPPITKPRP